MLYLLFFLSELIILFFLSHRLANTLAQLIYRITKSRKVVLYILSLFLFPGTVIHELSHYFTAALLLVKVGEINLFPQMKENEVIFGSVQIAKTDPLRRFFIGVAPLLVGIGMITALLTYFDTITIIPFIWKQLLLGYIVFEIGNTMFSSKKDMEGAIELFIALGVLVILFYILGFQIHIPFPQEVLTDVLPPIIKQISFYFLLPIGIDIGVIGLLKLLSK